MAHLANNVALRDDPSIPELHGTELADIELTPANSPGQIQSREEISKKNDSKSQGESINEVLRKPKQNNFIEMVEM